MKGKEGLPNYMFDQHSFVCGHYNISLSFSFHGPDTLTFSNYETVNVTKFDRTSWPIQLPLTAQDKRNAKKRMRLLATIPTS